MKKIYLSFLFSFLLLTSCDNPLNQGLKTTDSKERLQFAKTLFENQKYSQVIQLTEILRKEFNKQPEFMEVVEMSAKSNLELKNYGLAQGEYKELYDRAPRDSKAEHYYGMYILALSKDLPDYNLDQKNADLFLSSLTSFKSQFPSSEKIAEFEKIEAQIKEGKIRKRFELAKQYFDTQNYKAAIYDLENFMSEHPESSYIPECEKLIVESKSLLAISSVLAKKKDRILEAIDAQNNFVQKYPELKDWSDSYLTRLNLAEKARQLEEESIKNREERFGIKPKN
ncbi:MAG: hypothetical protein C4K58_04420 [Flavobacteriaceae bacterium]|nr:MAG: hypothetical protein C4K58_04420 [Flavobacteriaceae bacterium]